MNNIKHSPILRDIIIRSCVQIEIFFKEWAKERCTNNSDFILLRKYNEKYKNGEIKGAKNWTIGDYFVFLEDIKTDFDYKIFVLPLNDEIEPFEDWTANKQMFWWKAYNEIKHSGHKAKKQATLKAALYSLAGLFQLHCAQRDSLTYLKKYSTIIFSENFGNLILEKIDITSPIDSKRYLFKAPGTGGKKYNLATLEHFKRKDLGQI